MYNSYVGVCIGSARLDTNMFVSVKQKSCIRGNAQYVIQKLGVRVLVG